jgi:hypothetical protein
VGVAEVVLLTYARIGVDPAVEFDYESQMSTEEVDDEPIDYLLPSECDSFRTIGPQQGPSSFLGRGRLLPQLARALPLRWPAMIRTYESTFLSHPDTVWSHAASE